MADSRDEDVFHDDCIELVMLIGSTDLRFVVTAGGARLDSRDGDIKWNAEWVAATHIGEQEWTAELAIPFAALEGRRPPSPEEPGSSLLFNVGRSTAPIRLVSSLFPGYDDRRRVGELVIGTPEQHKSRLEGRRGLRLNDVTMLLDKWSYDSVDDQARGRLRLVELGPAQAGPTALHARLGIFSEHGEEPLRTSTIGPLTAAVLDFQVALGELPPGSYRLQAEILDDANAVLRKVSHPLIRRADEPRSSAGRIPLMVDVPKSTAALTSTESPLPVYAGIPLPRSVMSRSARYRLFNRQGIELPCQAEPLTTWAPRGETQWLGLRFLATTGDIDSCELRFDSNAGDPPMSPARVVAVKRESGSVVVDTGPLRFELLARGYDGLHRVWFDTDGDGTAENDELVSADAPTGPYVVDQAGNRYETRSDPWSEVTIESAGPLCAVVRCSGWYRSEDGGRICRHVTRFVAHGGLPWVRVHHTLVFCADSREVAIADVGWPVEPREAVATARFGGEPRPIPVTLPAGGSVSLLQHEPDAFTLRELSLANPRAVKTVAEGKSAGGWVEAAGQDSAVAIGLRDFAATYPRELSAHERGLVLHLWPGAGIDKPVKLPTQDDLSELWFLHHRRLLDFRVPNWFSSFQAPGPFIDATHAETRHRYVRASAFANGMGVARSCEFFLNYRRLDRDTVRAVWTAVNAPPLAAATPSWMCSTAAFGPLSPVDRKHFPLIEQALDVRHDGERTIERFSVGMFNRGGSTSYFRPEVRSYDQMDRPWRLSHHGSPRVPWLLFARSGNRKFADYALQHGQWCADLGFCHYSTPEFERLGVEGKIYGGQCDYKGIVPWSRGGRVQDYNSMADFLVWMTAFSGDRRPLEVASEWGECVKQRFKPVVGRNAAGTLDTLLSLYEATWDMDYRELAERQFLAIADQQFLPSGHFRHGPWYDYAPWLAHYHRFTGSGRAADIAVAWSTRLMNDCWLGDGDLGDDTKFVPTMGYPLFDVFRIAYESNGDRRILDLAHGCSLLPALSTVSAPGTPFHGFDTYAMASHGGYYTQTVPYILPVLRANARGRNRALFPRWSLHSRRIQLLLQADADTPLELRVRLIPPRDGSLPHVKIMSDRGGIIGPSPVEMIKQPVRGDGNALEGENRHGFAEYARIVVPQDMLGGTVAVVLAYPRGAQEVGIYAPIQIDRRVRMVYSWDRGMRFGRGSAFYIQPARTAKEIAVRATADDFARPHMIAILDSQDAPAEVRQWYPTHSAPAVSIKATINPDDRAPICCLQGLTRHLIIEPESGNMPNYFSDRPERYFVPALPR